MTNKKNTDNKKNKQKRKKVKLLLRRIAIVSASLLIIWLVILMVFKGLKGLSNDKQVDSKATETQTSIDITETEVAIETQPSDETTNSTVPTDLTDLTDSTGNTSVATTEATASEAHTESTEARTESTETSTESTSKEVINMDFSVVSYYIQTRDARYQAYFLTHKAMSASEIVRDVNMNLDFNFYGQIEKVDDPNALLVICNKYYQLPSDFTPENLTNVPEGYFVADGKSYQLKQNALDAFIAMSNAAKKEGLSLRIISAYRTNSYQANLYQKYKNNNGQKAADRFSARPGHSEHETGLAIDINDVAQAFENTQEFTWLGKHAHEYGYVLRYPAGKENVTGYMYEPWHYRFLGVETATQLKNLGVTYDAYYAMYLLK